MNSVQGGFEPQCCIDCTRLTLQANSLTSLTLMGALSVIARGVRLVWNYSVTQPVGVVNWYRSTKPEQSPVISETETAQERERPPEATASPTAPVLKRRCVIFYSSIPINAKLYI